jgi:hypothetical protein
MPRRDPFRRHLRGRDPFAPARAGRIVQQARQVRREIPMRPQVDLIAAQPNPPGLQSVKERAYRAGSLFPIRLHGIVYPLLNRACVKAIVVVMAAAVPAAIAYVGDESLGCAAGAPRQENATA